MNSQSSASIENLNYTVQSKRTASSLSFLVRQSVAFTVDYQSAAERIDSVFEHHCQFSPAEPTRRFG
jgi:hypothetical protein